MGRKAQTSIGSTEGEQKAFIKGFIAGSTMILDTLDKQLDEMHDSLKRVLMEGEGKNDN